MKPELQTELFGIETHVLEKKLDGLETRRRAEKVPLEK